MKHFLAICFLLLGTFQIDAQDTPKIDSDEMQKQMESAMSELQSILDTLDINALFNGSELGNLFGEGFSNDMNIEGLDSLGGFNLDNLLGGDLSQFFGEGLPNELDMEQLNGMMEMSLKMMEQIDVSELQKMFEGFNFDFEGMEDMFPQGPEDESPAEDGEKKKRKMKKI